jgi:type IV pilus assembly protein PilB
MDIAELLAFSVKNKASDLHLSAGLPPMIRVHGDVRRINVPPLEHKDVHGMVYDIMNDSQRKIYEETLECDFSFEIPNLARFRVNAFNQNRGAGAVFRTIPSKVLSLEDLNAPKIFAEIANQPRGLVLVTGPTGSGKTNTLYSAIASLNKPDTNIMTAEDPVEFNLPGINQVQIKDQIGLNFAAVLRSFLRQDPNIILVGEIRDYETAEIAVKAALTGHLVLSTLHTNDAPSTISRLVNMGIEPFLVGTAVNLIQAQRLIRRVCNNCKHEVHDVPSKTLLEIGVTPEEIGGFKLFKGKGCGTCNGTGYKGRVGLYEVMEISEGIRDLVMVGATSVELKRKALEEGMLTLRLSGIEKIKAGITTIEEVLRETVL